MPLMSPKPPKKPALAPVYGYRPPAEQMEWWKAKMAAGWNQTQILTEVVATFMRLESALGPLEKDLEAFARAEGIIKEGQSLDEDRGWVRDALILWVKAGHADWERSKKKGR
jgi:hypothetical protein